MPFSEQHLYIGPYLELTSEPTETKQDLCQQPSFCVNPGNGANYCHGCGIRLNDGLYVEPEGWVEGRYRYRWRPPQDFRELLANVDGFGRDTFIEGGHVPPKYDPETKSFRYDGLYRTCIFAVGKPQLGVLRRIGADETFDMSDIHIQLMIQAATQKYEPAIAALRKTFEVSVRYGALLYRAPSKP